MALATPSASAPRAALADYAGDNRDLKAHHQLQIGGDRLGLAALLRAEPRLRALRVYKCDERQAHAAGQVVHPRRLAVALRMGLAEVAPNPLLGRAAALMAHDRDRAAAEVAESRHDRAVISETAVAVNLEKVAHQVLDVVQGLRARRIARQTHAFDRTRRCGRRRGACGGVLAIG